MEKVIIVALYAAIAFGFGLALSSLWGIYVFPSALSL